MREAGTVRMHVELAHEETKGNAQHAGKENMSDQEKLIADSMAKDDIIHSMEGSGEIRTEKKFPPNNYFDESSNFTTNDYYRESSLDDTFDKFDPRTLNDSDNYSQPSAHPSSANNAKRHIQGLSKDETLGGEQQCMSMDAYYVFEHSKIQGQLLMTTYRLVFSPFAVHFAFPKGFFTFPLGLIAKYFSLSH